MENKKNQLMEDVLNRFQQIGGFTWEQAEAWAGLCNAVGMDPLPFLKVILNNVCKVQSTSSRKNIPDHTKAPELWVVFKGCRTCFKIVKPA